MKLRPFTGEIVTLAGHRSDLRCISAAPDGHIITGTNDGTIKIWRDGACVRTIPPQDSMIHIVQALTVLPGGARFVSGSRDCVKMWTIDGALERTFPIEAPRHVYGIAALPDGVHIVVGLGKFGLGNNQVRLYHVDGTLVHAFEGHATPVWALFGDARRQAHHQRLG